MSGLSPGQFLANAPKSVIFVNGDGGDVGRQNVQALPPNVHLKLCIFPEDRNMTGEYCSRIVMKLRPRACADSAVVSSAAAEHMQIPSYPLVLHGVPGAYLLVGCVRTGCVHPAWACASLQRAASAPPCPAFALSRLLRR